MVLLFFKHQISVISYLPHMFVFFCLKVVNPPTNLPTFLDKQLQSKHDFTNLLFLSLYYIVISSQLLFQTLFAWELKVQRCVNFFGAFQAFPEKNYHCGCLCSCPEVKTSKIHCCDHWLFLITQQILFLAIKVAWMLVKRCLHLAICLN